jgi:hypothetical protein
MVFTGFVAGIGAYKAVLEIAHLVVVSESADLATIAKELETIREENKRLKLENSQTNAKNAQLVREIEALSMQVRKERDRASASGDGQSRLSGPMQAAPAEPRFIDHGDGTISDKTTGLMWTEDDSAVALGRCLSFDGAKDWTDSLRTGGHSDWRMPSTDESRAIAGEKVFGAAANYHWCYDVTRPGDSMWVSWRSGTPGGSPRTLCGSTGARAVRQENRE